MDKAIKNFFSIQKGVVSMLCVVFVSFFIVWSCTAVDENTEFPITNEVTVPTITRSDTKIWDYPFRPGSEKWRQLKSMDEMFEICQIPEEVLKSLDTESLVQICYDFPSPMTLFFYNSPQIGFNVFYEHFNGIRELMSRKDVGYAMLEKYKSMSMKDFNSLWTLENQGRFSLMYQYFEILLAQPQIIGSLDEKGRTELLKETVEKFEMKLSMSDVFGGRAFSCNAWVMANILYSQNKLIPEIHKSSEIGGSLKSGQLVGYDLMSIYKQAKSHVQ